MLRAGEIKFKWAGKHKVVEKNDADAWADSQPYAEAKIMAPKLVGPKVVGIGGRSDTRNRDRNGTRPRPLPRKARFLGFKKMGSSYVVMFR